jgi:hypothetical protein
MGFMGKHAAATRRDPVGRSPRGDDVPVFPDVDNLEMCWSSHGGYSSRRELRAAETSSRFREKGVRAEEGAVNGSSEYPSSGCGLNEAMTLVQLRD